ncbi:MAG: AI-2E family transporter [Acuticoccus sp.]
MYTAVTIAATIWILQVAESVLRPLAIAVLVFFILSAVSARIVKLVPSRFRRGRVMARLVSIVGVGLILLALGLLVSESIVKFSNNLETYEKNLDFLLLEVQKMFGADQKMQVMDLLRKVDFRQFAISLAGSTAAYASMFFVVVLYIAFVIVEAQQFGNKLSAIATTPEQEKRLHHFAGAVKRGIDDILGIQVFVGALQAVPTFVLLAVIGVDGAVLWAVFVFLFSFIPTIGTIFGIAIPALMTLIQFMSLELFVLVLVLVGAVQLYGTNILLPQLMSRSLSLSSLVVLIAVFAGGALWGIVGALIAVPVLTVAMIVCSETPRLRPIAIMLSAQGTLPTYHPSDEPEDAHAEADAPQTPAR